MEDTTIEKNTTPSDVAIVLAYHLRNQLCWQTQAGTLLRVLLPFLSLDTMPQVRAVRNPNRNPNPNPNPNPNLNPSEPEPEPPNLYPNPNPNHYPNPDTIIGSDTMENDPFAEIDDIAYELEVTTLTTHDDIAYYVTVYTVPRRGNH